jgi:cytochrome c6
VVSSGQKSANWGEAADSGKETEMKKSDSFSSVSRTVLGIAFVGALALALPAISRANSAATTYKAKCSVCHGADGKGETMMGKKFGMRSFASPEDQKMTDAQLEEIIAKGKGKMPAYEKQLKPAEIKGLVSYIRELAKGK